MHVECLQDLVYTGGRSGWPWTATEHHIDRPAPKGREWPRVTIVTPSYEQGQFIEETIRSVLLQDYPSLEYIIIDGGSTDHTVDIIKKYERWLTYWVSEKDRGQSHAINKGFSKGTGEILIWLNSDDIQSPNAIWDAVTLLTDQNTNWLVGAAYIGASWDDAAKRYEKKAPTLDEVRRGRTFFQPSTYFSRHLYDRVGGVNESLHFAMDYDLWCRFIAAGEWPAMTDKVLSLARTHVAMKTRLSNDRLIWEERRPIIQNNLGVGGYLIWRICVHCRRLPILGRLCRNWASCSRTF